MHNVLISGNQNAQISFLTLLRLMQFSCTNTGNFPDDFMGVFFFYTKTGYFPDNFMSFIVITKTDKFPDDLWFCTRYAIIIRWIFCCCNFWVPYIKLVRANQFSMLSSVWNNKNQKIAKDQLPQKFNDGDNIRKAPSSSPKKECHLNLTYNVL